MVLLSNLFDIVKLVVACWNEFSKGAAGVCRSDGLHYALIVFGHVSTLFYRGVNFATAERAFFAAIVGAYAGNLTHLFGELPPRGMKKVIQSGIYCKKELRNRYCVAKQ